MSAAPRFSTADIARGARQPDATAPAENRPADNRPADNRPAEHKAIELPASTSEPDAATVRVDEARRAAGVPDAVQDDTPAPLFAREAADDFQHRWDGIQAGFVDDPRKAVQEADALVAETMQRLAESFSQQRSRLEQELDRGRDAEAGQASTEDLRLALRHYRSFFKRLLAV